jgi:dTDP-4-amino-4,6-dideoxygalactose transaminase
LIKEVLNSKLLASGKYISWFDHTTYGVKFGIANVNGTVSLHIAFLMCGVLSWDINCRLTNLVEAMRISAS